MHEALTHLAIALLELKATYRASRPVMLKTGLSSRAVTFVYVPPHLPNGTFRVFLDQYFTWDCCAAFASRILTHIPEYDNWGCFIHAICMCESGVDEESLII